MVLFYTTYQEALGTRLLSHQLVEPHGFTLYFLASSTQSPPNADIDALENREWLWQRPYTTLELQHFWPGEQQGVTCTRHDGQTPGFWGIGFESHQPDAFVDPWAKMTARSPVTLDATGNPSLIGVDPDGNRVRIEKSP